jgi:phosphoglycolate phosphatase
MMGELLSALGADASSFGVVTGDRHDDVEAAHAHGLRAIGAAYGYGGPGELDAADALVHDPADLSATVLRMLEGGDDEQR